MRRVLATVVTAALLTGCGGPVFVPEAGPNAPGYREIDAPPAPEVELTSRKQRFRGDGGVVDGVVRTDDRLVIDGWALLDDTDPRGTLVVVLPDGSARDARVDATSVASRSDVVAATSDPDLLWSGFSITVVGVGGSSDEVCVVSRSSKGAFRLGGSDAGLCPG